MSALLLSSPFPVFTNKDGTPLEDGYIYIGTQNLNPETNPITVYFDSGLTIPAAQPIRTIGGYPSRNGSASQLYVTSSCSVTVRDKKGTLVFNDLVYTGKGAQQNVVDSIAALRSITGKSGQNTSTLGYYSAGDGGGNSFYWSSTSTATDNGGTVIKPTSVSGAGRWLSVRTNDINVLQFGVKANDLTVDYSAQFQAAHDALDTTGGKITIPAGGYSFIASNPTIYAPKRGMLITKNNVFVQAEGATFYMKGMTRAYLDSISDLSSSGRDVFTCFTFLRTNGCLFNGGNFVGEWDTTGTFVYTSPRAKAVGIIGGNFNRVQSVGGSYILGNLVNATPSDATIDGVYQTCIKPIVTNCNAVYCYENGINFMGNTFSGVFSNSIAQYCGSAGFESATSGMVATNNILTYNRLAGASLSGSDTSFSNNTCSNSTGGFGIILSSSASSSSKNIIVANNNISSNYSHGLQVYPYFQNITISSNKFYNNNTSATASISDIHAVGSAAGIIKKLTITNNSFIDDRGTPLTTYACNLSYVDSAIVSNNTQNGAITISFLVQGSSLNVSITNNKVSAIISISTSAANSYSSLNAGYERAIINVSTIPTAGTWNQGDIAFNKAATAGGFVGWVCVTAGTPGTWKTFGAISV